MKTVLNTNKNYSHIEAKMFLYPNGGVGMKRYESVKYRHFEKVADKH